MPRSCRIGPTAFRPGGTTLPTRHVRPHLRTVSAGLTADANRLQTVTPYPLREAAELLGVSDDSVRRWADTGRVPTTVDAAGRRVVEGATLARFAEQNAGPVPDAGAVVRESARNRFVGLVTRVVRDTVMAQVEMQCGPYRVV